MRGHRGPDVNQHRRAAIRRRVIAALTHALHCDFRPEGVQGQGSSAGVASPVALGRRFRDNLKWNIQGEVFAVRAREIGMEAESDDGPFLDPNLGKKGVGDLLPLEVILDCWQQGNPKNNSTNHSLHVVGHRKRRSGILDLAHACLDFRSTGFEVIKADCALLVCVEKAIPLASQFFEFGLRRLLALPSVWRFLGMFSGHTDGSTAAAANL